MGIDVRPGSPYTGQLVCSCADGGGFQGMAPNCCPTDPPTTAAPATGPPSDSAGSGGSGLPSATGGTSDTADEADETTVVVTETEEANWFDGEWIDGVKNKWLVAGIGTLIISLCCFCLMFLLLVVR